MYVRSKTTRKSHLKPDVVMTLFLHENLAIRNLTITAFKSLIRDWHENVSPSVEQANLSKTRITKYLTYCLSPLFGQNGLRKPDLNSSVI